ncbi:DUF1993 domain-containing protein [Jeotgalibacillus aurantiacus]|nr:hypothetical protein [Jeotgalibacillus aurantiacus]
METKQQLTSQHLSAILKKAHKKGEQEKISPVEMVQWLASEMRK